MEKSTLSWIDPNLHEGVILKAADNAYRIHGTQTGRVKMTVMKKRHQIRLSSKQQVLLAFPTAFAESVKFGGLWRVVVWADENRDIMLGKETFEPDAWRAASDHRLVKVAQRIALSASATRPR